MLDLRFITVCLDPPLTLRQAKQTDLEFIEKVSHAEMDKIVPKNWNWKSWFADIEKATQGNFHKVFIIQVQDIPAGYLWLNEELNSLWITAIVLESKYQRRRIGKEIMNYLIDETRKEGKEFIELGVQHNNAVALNFYSKFGFKQYDHLRVAHTDLIRLKVTKKHS